MFHPVFLSVHPIKLFSGIIKIKLGLMVGESSNPIGNWSASFNNPEKELA
jgi:hypothetical protein